MSITTYLRIKTAMHKKAFGMYTVPSYEFKDGKPVLTEVGVKQPNQAVGPKYYPPDRYNGDRAPLPHSLNHSADGVESPIYYPNVVDREHSYDPERWANTKYDPNNPDSNMNAEFEWDPDKPKYIKGGIVWRGMFIPDKAIQTFIKNNDPNYSIFNKKYVSTDKDGNTIGLPDGITPQQIIKYTMDRANRPYKHKRGTLRRWLEDTSRALEFRENEILGGNYETLNAPVDEHGSVILPRRTDLGPDGERYMFDTRQVISPEQDPAGLYGVYTGSNVPVEDAQNYLMLNRGALSNTRANIADYSKKLPMYSDEAAEYLGKPGIIDIIAGNKGMVTPEQAYNLLKGKMPKDLHKTVPEDMIGGNIPIDNLKVPLYYPGTEPIVQKGDTRWMYTGSDMPKVYEERSKQKEKDREEYWKTVAEGLKGPKL